VPRTGIGWFTSAFLAAVKIASPSAYQRLRLSRELTFYCRTKLGHSKAVVSLVMRRANEKTPHRLLIRRDRNRITLSCRPSIMSRRSGAIDDRILPSLALIAAVPFEQFQFVAETSDGEVSGPGLISFCSRDPQAILVPDNCFVASDGYEQFRALGRSNVVAWRRRNDKIVWRGTTTGGGVIAKDELLANDPDLIPRVRLCLATRGMPGTDIKIAHVAQTNDKALAQKQLRKAGILGEWIAPISWCSFKFAIDIDGNSNAWSNFFTRLLMGCCVIKVESPTGYRQWYYDKIKPWTHFVPVKTDLSDLSERIAWCRANLDACERIAANGQELAMALDFNGELAGAVQRLCDAAAAGTLRTQL
jgi:hypothetical protein